MTTLTEQEIAQSENVVTNMFRYVYWVSLDKEAATQIVRSALCQLPRNLLLNAENSEQGKLEVLKYLQSECEKNAKQRTDSYRNICRNSFEQQVFPPGPGSDVQTLRTQLRNVAALDRAIFVLIYLWKLHLAQAADVLQIPRERVETGFKETLKNLQSTDVW